MIKKLKQQKGETLVESMFSMLIALLSMGMVATCAMTAAKINEGNRVADERFYDDLQQAEGYDETKDTESQIVITFEEGSVISTTADVTLYGDSDSSFISYDYEIEED